MSFSNLTEDLRHSIGEWEKKLLNLDEKVFSSIANQQGRTIKQIIGHLIDSASNNHQRIVRMQETSDLGTFRYAQDHWVKVQQYQVEPWIDLVELWFAYNLHLAHIIRNVDPAAMEHVCDVGYPKPVTLRYLLDDYVDHLEHHLKQILSDGDPKERRPRAKREL